MEDPSAPPPEAPIDEPAPRPPWEEGDPLRASAALTFVAEKLCEGLDLRFAQRVLDIGTGTGNTALAAARRGARSYGLDPANGPLLLARGRAAAEGVRVRWIRGRAESLPFVDGAFDVSVSTFGAMFSDDAEMAADEMVRVTREGGTVGLASWTSEGLLGKIYEAAEVPGEEPEGPDPMVWGSREKVSRWFGSNAGQLTTALRTVKLRGPTPEKFAEYLAKTLGPVVRGMVSRDPVGQRELLERLAEICRGANRSEDETFLGPAQYLEVIVRLR